MFHSANTFILAGMYPERYTFAGKEKDPESGLAYAGARYYNPRYSIFTSTDPMWAKYPGLSPYNYCANNPVMLVDPDGREPIYGIDGTYIGNTQEGFKGQILIYDGEKQDFSNMTTSEFLAIGSNANATASTYEKASADEAINSQAKENIINNVLSNAEGMQTFDKTFSMSNLTGGKVLL